VSVSKRTRYEVLRRDNHACRYCGGVAPDVVLTVDHVTPVSLGGSDDPSNLVAACKDCNAGKSSSSPDATLVADVDQDAIRWAATLRAALQETAVDIKALNKVRKAFLAAWGPGHKSDLPSDYISTIEQWVKVGVPIEVMTYAAEVASGKTGLRYGDRFRYACGIVWRKVDDAREKAAPLGARRLAKVRCGHCGGCSYVRSSGETGEAWAECRLQAELHEDEEPTLCRHCGEEACHFEDGWQDGNEDGWRVGYDKGLANAWTDAHNHYRPDRLASLELRSVVDLHEQRPGVNGWTSTFWPAMEDARSKLEADIADRGITALVDEAATRDPWARQEAPF
jgi:ferredoxin